MGSVINSVNELYSETQKHFRLKIGAVCNLIKALTYRNVNVLIAAIYFTFLTDHYL